MTLRPLEMAGHDPEDYPQCANPRAWRIAATFLVCGTISAGIVLAGITFCGVFG